MAKTINGKKNIIRKEYCKELIIRNNIPKRRERGRLSIFNTPSQASLYILMKSRLTFKTSKVFLNRAFVSDLQLGRYVVKGNTFSSIYSLI